MNKGLKTFLFIALFFVLFKGYIFFFINPSINLKPLLNQGLLSELKILII
jgi:hypothetical protein